MIGGLYKPLFALPVFPLPLIMDANGGGTEDPSTPLLPTPPTEEEEDEDEDDVDVEDPFQTLARETPSPDSVPWEQRSTTMKLVHVADRVFLAFLALFLLLLMAEISYIIYQITPWSGIFQYLTDRLLMQEEGEEEFEL